MNIFLNWDVLGRSVQVKLDLTNYLKKKDLKNAIGVGAWRRFAKNVELARLKSEFDKLAIDELETPFNSFNLSKLKDVL